MNPCKKRYSLKILRAITRNKSLIPAWNTTELFELSLQFPVLKTTPLPFLNFWLESSFCHWQFSSLEFLWGSPASPPWEWYLREDLCAWKKWWSVIKQEGKDKTIKRIIFRLWACFTSDHLKMFQTWRWLCKAPCNKNT